MPSQLRASLLDQMTVTDFMEQGHFPRHIRRMRALYMGRRAALMRALERRFGDQLDIEVPAGGMHVIARLPRGSNDIAIVKKARTHGLAPAALSLFAMKAKCGPGLLLSFTNIPVGRAEVEVENLHRAICKPLREK
jgi:GntR family transcriptional regulator/MocR family aminotransferase